jgi:hypothetical protein
LSAAPLAVHSFPVEGDDDNDEDEDEDDDEDDDDDDLRRPIMEK